MVWVDRRDGLKRPSRENRSPPSRRCAAAVGEFGGLSPPMCRGAGDRPNSWPVKPQGAHTGPIYLLANLHISTPRRRARAVQAVPMGRVPCVRSLDVASTAELIRGGEALISSATSFYTLRPGVAEFWRWDLSTSTRHAKTLYVERAHSAGAQAANP